MTAMEFTSLVLDESALSALPEPKRPLYVFEWLRFLEKALDASTSTSSSTSTSVGGGGRRAEIKADQKRLVEQLMGIVQQAGAAGTAVAGPPTRKRVAHCLTTLFRDDSDYAELLNS
jgi:hypothetical protein